MLTGVTHKFWNLSEAPRYCYEFKENGGCRYYYYTKTEGKVLRKLFPFDDIVITEAWKFVNDSIIIIQDFHYRYRFINDSLLELVNVKRPDDTSYLKQSLVQELPVTK